MPNYTYQHEGTGRYMTALRNIDERDEPLAVEDAHLWHRVPDAPGIIVSMPKPPTQAERVMKAFSQIENDPKRETRKPISAYGDRRAAQIWKDAMEMEKAGLRQTQQDSELPKDHPFLGAPQEAPGDSKQLITTDQT